MTRPIGFSEHLGSHTHNRFGAQSRHRRIAQATPDPLLIPAHEGAVAAMSPDARHPWLLARRSSRS